MRRIIILAAALAIIVLGLWGTAVIYFDEDRLKELVTDRLGGQLDRRVEILGALRFRLFPFARIDAEDVVVSGREGPESSALTAERFSMRLQVLPLLRGEFSPSQVKVSGAVIDLESAGSPGSRSDPMSTFRSGARFLSGRSLQLRDVTLLLPERSIVESIVIDHVEFERFSLDRSVAFRFRGALGDPPLLEDVEMEGMLQVPASTAKPIRLRDMRLTGRLVAFGLPASVKGELTISREPPLRIALSGGRLGVADRLYDVALTYHDNDDGRHAADLLVSGPKLDWAAVNAVPIGQGKPGLATLLARLSARLDLRSQLQFDQLVLGRLALSDVRIDLRSQSEGLAVTLASTFQGGLAEASGVLTGRGRNALVVEAGVAHLSQLLSSLDLPPVVGGSGEARLNLEWPARDGSGYRLAGVFDLWNGYWRIGSGDSDVEPRKFDRFSGEIRLSPDYLELPGFEVLGSELSGAGWAAVALPEGRLGGEIRSRGPHGDRTMGLYGTLAAPRLSSGPSASVDRDGSAEAQALGPGR